MVIHTAIHNSITAIHKSITVTFYRWAVRHGNKYMLKDRHVMAHIKNDWYFENN